MLRTILYAAVLGASLIAPGFARDVAAAPSAPRMLLTGLNVHDLDRSLIFYRDIIGMKEATRYTFPGTTEVVLNFSGSSTAAEASVVLIHTAGAAAPLLGNGFSRIGIATDEVAAIVARVRTAGGVVVREPFDAHGATLAFVKDPDGYTIELVRLPRS